MKKIFAIMLALAFLFVLVGCDPVMHTISKEDLLANTVKVELWGNEPEYDECRIVYEEEK